MEDEKLLPTGESTPHELVPPIVPLYKSPAAPVPQAPIAPMSRYTPPTEPAPVLEPVTPPTVPGMPSPAAQQWGVVISIVIIVLMIIIGAFYAWGQRIAQNQIPAATAQ